MISTKNIYLLPFAEKYFVDAVADPRAHFAHFKYAIDFGLAEGTEIIASKSGIVVDVKVDSNKGGMSQKYSDLKYLNYITLRHSNGELSQYAHLKYKGALVKLGDKVKAGQPIALSGNTGFSTEPHLHFQVFKRSKTKIGWKTLRIKFKKKLVIDRSSGPTPKNHVTLAKELKRIKKELQNVA